MREPEGVQIVDSHMTKYSKLALKDLVAALVIRDPDRSAREIAQEVKREFGLNSPPSIETVRRTLAEIDSVLR